ncbi:hypothetical protein BDZ91DRAFT_748288 [Kalaharituber pfeilii]|nr:hypothetical protein BDZ91DRAFT_748288 [Kalaharituber pfeilii]
MALSFPQGGQVDWVALASKPVTTTIGVLDRLAQAGIQPYTLELCRIARTAFKIPDENLIKIEKALLNSKIFGISSGALFFGTGISSIPRILAETRGGVSFAALLVVLRTSFSANYAARVVTELLRQICPKETILPSLSQLENLTNEVISTGADTQLANIMWGIQRTRYIVNQHFLPKAPPRSENLASLLKSMVLHSAPQGDIVIRALGDTYDITWIAAFCRHVMGFSVVLLDRSLVIWESEPPQQVAPSRSIRIECLPNSEALPCDLNLIMKAHIEFRLRADLIEQSPRCKVPVSQVARQLLDFIGGLRFLLHLPLKLNPGRSYYTQLNISQYSRYGAQAWKRLFPDLDFFFPPTFAKEVESLDLTGGIMTTTESSAIIKEVIGVNTTIHFERAFIQFVETGLAVYMGNGMYLSSDIPTLFRLWALCLFIDCLGEAEPTVCSSIQGSIVPHTLGQNTASKLKLWHQMPQGGESITSTFLDYIEVQNAIFHFFTEENMAPECLAQADGGTFCTRQLTADCKLDMIYHDPFRFYSGPGGIFLNGKRISVLYSVHADTYTANPLDTKQYARYTILEYTQSQLPKLDLEQVLIPMSFEANLYALEDNKSGSSASIWWEIQQKHSVNFVEPVIIRAETIIWCGVIMCEGARRGKAVRASTWGTNSNHHFSHNRFKLCNIAEIFNTYMSLTAFRVVLCTSQLEFVLLMTHLGKRLFDPLHPVVYKLPEVPLSTYLKAGTRHGGLCNYNTLVVPLYFGEQDLS